MFGKIHHSPKANKTRKPRQRGVSLIEWSFVFNHLIDRTLDRNTQTLWMASDDTLSSSPVQNGSNQYPRRNQTDKPQTPNQPTSHLRLHCGTSARPGCWRLCSHKCATVQPVALPGTARSAYQRHAHKMTTLRLAS